MKSRKKALALFVLSLVAPLSREIEDLSLSGLVRTTGEAGNLSVIA